MSISAKNVLPSVLMEAIRKGDMKFVRKLVDDGADVNHHDVFGCSPLCIAAKNADAAMVQLLLDTGADVRAGFYAGGSGGFWRALDFAVDRNDNAIAIVQALLAAGAPVDDESSLERPLMRALKTRQLAIVRLLAEHGASLTGTLKLAARDDDLGLARFLLSLGADPNGGCGRAPPKTSPVVASSPASIVVGSPSSTVVNSESFSDSDDLPNVDESTALFDCRSVPMARLLIEAGCNLDARNSRGFSVVHRIVSAGSRFKDLLLFLCACGVDMNAGMLFAEEYGAERNMYFVLGAAGATLDLSPGQLRRLKLISKADVRHCVEYAAYELARAQVDLIREPSFQICLGLESIHLPAFVTCCILEFACEPFTNCVKFHHFWNIATKVKHHFQVKE
jgi:hypothetical protein